jgi:hypothetical protein
MLAVGGRGGKFGLGFGNSAGLRGESVIEKLTAIATLLAKRSTIKPEPETMNIPSTSRSHCGRASGKMVFGLLAALLVAAAGAGFSKDQAGDALKDAVILIIRHAEKPGEGRELSPAGELRAAAYVQYFTNYTVDAKPLNLDCLIAAADSAKSRRPRLTLEPLSKSLGLKIASPFKDKQFDEMAHDLQTTPHGKRILICWHHGKIPELAQALGADPGKLLPGGRWPDDEFGWVLQLRYDHDGHLIADQTKRINENLMPDDGKVGGGTPPQIHTDAETRN